MPLPLSGAFRNHAAAQAEAAVLAVGFNDFMYLELPGGRFVHVSVFRATRFVPQNVSACEVGERRRPASSYPGPPAAATRGQSNGSGVILGAAK